MKLEVTLELDIKITEGPININGIIKAVHLYQNELGKNIVREVLEAIDRKARMRRNACKEMRRAKARYIGA